MTENETQKPEEILNKLLANLKSNDDTQIFNAFAELKNINYSSEAIRRQVERILVSSSNSQVRDEARAVLNLASNRAVQKSSNTLERGIRATLLNEIKKWTNDGLLAKENADVIQSRYDFDFIQTPQPTSAQQKVSQPETPAEPKAPAPSLLQTLTSEASIKVYLYLGAFFVIAAAAILGAVIEELRLPILILGTLLFGGLSIAIKKRLPQPSFALFIVFSFLLTITANSIEQTLQETIGYENSVTSIYWAFVLLVITAIWAVAIGLYNSRLFSITAYGALIGVFINITNVFEASPEIYTLVGSVVAFVGLAATWLIQKWRDKNFALPIFVSSQFVQFVVLSISLIAFFVKLFDSETQSFWYIIPVFVWLLASVYFIASDKLYPFIFSKWFSASALIPIPFFFAITFNREGLGASILFLWAIMLAMLSEIFYRVEKVREYSLPLLFASIPVFMFALIFGFSHENWLGLSVAVAVAIFFTILTILRARWWLWMLAVFNFVIAYFSFFQLEAIQKLEISFVYQIMFASLLFCLPDVFLKKDWSDNLKYRLPIRIFGGLFVLMSITLLFGESENMIALGLGIYTLLFLTLSLLYRTPNLLYLATFLFPLFAVFLFRSFGFTKWIHPVIVIAMIYYAIGFVLRSVNRLKGWDSTLLYSGLGLGVIVSIASPTLGGVDASIPVAVAATLWAVEAFSKKNAWLAFPANGLYLMSYFILLNELNVQEIQFFSMGAGLIGLIQHYLLTRSESKSGAFAMGMLSQFVLLGTTYIEMINKNDLSYFFLLFLQSLAVLIYGLVIRSRSLTFFPIGFVILGVVTVAYNALQEVGAIFLIGCTGILLLGLGILAVLLRERIAKLGEKLSDWQA